MENQNHAKALTPEEASRDLSDMALLLSTLRDLPPECKIYLAGFANAMTTRFPLVRASAAPRPTA